MSLFQRFLTYIGLGPEHQYDDGGQHIEARDTHATGTHMPNTQASPLMTARRTAPYRAPAQNTAAYTATDYNTAAYNEGAVNESIPTQSINRIISTGHAEPKVVMPQTFESVTKIADFFMRNHPVIINLDLRDKRLARRIMDFASGICYMGGGKIKRVGGDVFLLTPKNLHMSDEDVAVYLEESQNAAYN